MSRTAVIDIDHVVSDHASHVESVAPGLPAEFNAANVPGDCIVQGDVYITVVGNWPKGHEPVDARKLTEVDRQIVPETGAGSHHRLDSLDGVEMRRPPGWKVDKDTESLDGPSFRVGKPTVLRHCPGHDHPHGPVTLVPGHIYHATYQRTLVGEERREARARD
jgi:hypothetical protein